MIDQLSSGHLIICDGDLPPPSAGTTCVSWNGYMEPDGVISLLRHVEQHADHLRNRYLEWVDDLGQVEIRGKRVVDLMVVGSTGFSLWWMSSIFEKSFWNTSTMSSVVRLLALDDLVGMLEPGRVTVISDRLEIRKAVRRLCAARGIPCAGRRVGVESVSASVRRSLAGMVPRPLRALRALTDYALATRPARGRRPRQWDGSPDALFLLSCFGHLDSDEAASGRFDSRYWQGLYEVFRETGTPTNWLQYHVASGELPGFETVVEWLERIDANDEDQGNHVFVSAYFSTGVMSRVLGRWIRQLVVGVRLRTLGTQGSGPDGLDHLWPMVRSEWLDDLRGARSMHHQIWLAIFEEACNDLPVQRRGLYLHEGVSWERAFVHAWRAAGHGELVGVPHATIRFWDLRYYVHPRTRARGGPHALPQPDRLVRNSVTARAAFEAVDLPEESIVDCESLRYAHLIGIGQVGRTGRSVAPLRILVLGEVRASAMRKMLSMLADALSGLEFEVELAVKPHPNSPISAADHPELEFHIVGGSLSGLVDEFDMAYSSNGTSAGVDALLAGLPVIVWLDENDLNLSDLRGLRDVRFVGDAQDLVESLCDVRNGTVVVAEVPEFFTLDAGLPGWRRLIAESTVGSAAVPDRGDSDVRR